MTAAGGLPKGHGLTTRGVVEPPWVLCRACGHTQPAHRTSGCTVCVCRRWTPSPKSWAFPQLPCRGCEHLRADHLPRSAGGACQAKSCSCRRYRKTRLDERTPPEVRAKGGKPIRAEERAEHARQMQMWRQRLDQRAAITKKQSQPRTASPKKSLSAAAIPDPDAPGLTRAQQRERQLNRAAVQRRERVERPSRSPRGGPLTEAARRFTCRCNHREETHSKKGTVCAAAGCACKAYRPQVDAAPDQDRSVRTVSGGLPTLGRRRQ